MLKSGWETKKFIDVLDIRNGRNQKSVESESGTYPIMGSAGNVMGYATAYICEAGTTIIGRKGNISNPIYVEMPFWNVDTAFGLSPKVRLHNKFLYYYCLSYDFAALNRGTTIPSLVKSELLEIPIPVPPLPEQKCIVAILDEAFTNISQAVANAEKNLVNARELFDSYVNEVFTRKGEGWEEKTVSEIADHCLGKMLDKNKNKGTLKPYLRNVNVRWFDVDVSDLLEMRFEEAEFKKYSVTKGDLLICEGGYPGRAAIWNEDDSIFFQKAIHRVRCKNPQHNAWIMYFLYLSNANGNLKKYCAGAGIQHFTGQSLAKFRVPIVSDQEVANYLKKIKFLHEKVKELEDVYRRKLAALAELKQALLQKAFTGELTAN